MSGLAYISLDKLQRVESTLSLLTHRLALVDPEESKKDDKRVLALVLLLMIVYGSSRVVAQSTALQWLRRYTAQQIRQRVFTQVLINTLREGVRLISSMPVGEHEALVRDLLRLGGGRSRIGMQRLGELLQQKYTVDPTFLRLVVEDQASKYSAAVRQARQISRGGTNYIWWTMQDDRVRPTHRIKHGRQFSWLAPPIDTGHPGWSINCRCVAIPVL